MADPEIKIKRYADKENLKELIKYCKATFASKDGSTSGGGGTGGGSEVGDATIKINYGSTNLGSFTTNQSADAIVDIHPINELIRENYYIKSEVDDLLSYISIYSITKEEIEEICVL